MFSPLMAVFMAKACSELRLVLRQSNWRRFSGTRSSRCCLPRVIPLKNLRTAIQPDITYVVVFSLDSQGEFLYSPYHKKQHLIKFRYAHGSRSLALAVSTSVYTVALAFAPCGLPEKRKLFRPITKGRMAFSILLLSMGILPSWR
jgi:hypothetical protein